MIDPTSVPVRFTRLKQFSLSPLHYFDSLTNDYDTKSLRVGRGVHLIRSGLPLTVYEGERRGKAWDAFKAAHNGEDIATRKEFDLMRAVATAIESDPVVVREGLLDAPGCFTEQEIQWEWCGRKCQSTPDQFSSRILLDIKTTRFAKTSWFMREALRLSYPNQLAFYRDAIRHKYGFAPRELYIIAVETKRPYPVVVLKLTEELIDQAARQNRIWFEELLNCERSGIWPGYEQSVVTFGPPEMESDEDDEDGDELIINGESVSL